MKVETNRFITRHQNLRFICSLKSALDAQNVLSFKPTHRRCLPNWLATVGFRISIEMQVGKNFSPASTLKWTEHSILAETLPWTQTLINYDFLLIFLLNADVTKGTR